MSLPSPDKLNGLVLGARKYPMPSTSDFNRLLKAHLSARESATALSTSQLALLHSFGFQFTVYRALLAQKGPHHPEMASFLREIGLPRLAELSAGQTVPTQKVSAYIPCYNGARFLAGTIEALRSQSYPISEIIVVDDGSSDQSAAIARQLGATLLSHPRNLGLSVARNTAIAAAQGEIIAAIDADTRPHPFWLEHCMQQLSQSSAAAVGGRLIEQNAINVPDAWRARIMRQHHGDTTTVGMVVFGCNSVIAKRTLIAAGGYAPAFTRSFDDVDMTNKILAKGLQTLYVPDALCWHGRSDSLFSLLETAYHWRNPPFIQRGAFNSLRMLLPKWSITIQEDAQELRFLSEEGRVELLPLTYAHSFYCIARDILELRLVTPTTSMAIVNAVFVLLAATIGKLSRCGNSSKQFLTETLLNLHTLHDLKFPFVRLSELMLAPCTLKPEKLLEIEVPDLDGDSVALLSLALGDLHSILTFDQLLHGAIEDGACYIERTKQRSLVTIELPIMTPPSPPWRGEFGSALDPFDWIEAVAGTQPDQVIIRAREGSPTEQGYWLLRLLERNQDLNPRVEVSSANPELSQIVEQLGLELGGI